MSDEIVLDITTGKPFIGRATDPLGNVSSQPGFSA